MKGLKELFQIDKGIIEAVAKAEAIAKKRFETFEENAEYNQLKIIKAMQENRISEGHFAGTTGYGYGDIGREAIDSIYSSVFGTEDALVRVQFVAGTHAIVVALWSVLRPGDILLSVTGRPYDTLEKCIGIAGKESGSLAEYGVKYKEVPLDRLGQIDIEKILIAVKESKPKAVYIQRSRGYNWRASLKISDIRNLIERIKEIDANIICIVDNCYGEFVETQEPGHVGADIMVGSLIKNPGGGLAQTGAYIAGKKELVELASYRLTAPGLGKECGATLGANREILMGLFLAPHVVCESLKGAVFASVLMKELGYEVSPEADRERSDIIQAVRFGTREELIAFCQGIQKGAAVDSHVVPQPWDMPGYSNQIIMAAGTFVQGASIEVSADAPIREPYTVYFQGGLTYTHAKISVIKAIQELVNKGLMRF